jgi:uncharacterized protein (DUF1697 family)
MPIYVCMLRGINIGPHKRIKMGQLRKSFEALGFDQVKTYIQSGNAVFKTGKSSSAGLSKKIRKKILQDFGFPVSVVTRTADEMYKTVANNPFLKESAIDPQKLHVMFLSEQSTPAALKELDAVTVAPDQCRCSSEQIYFYLPNGVSKSVLWNSPVDRILAVITTTRNWKTVTQLAQMCEECR